MCVCVRMLGVSYLSLKFRFVAILGGSPRSPFTIYVLAELWKFVHD